jgi:hypothetical protein
LLALGVDLLNGKPFWEKLFKHRAAGIRTLDLFDPNEALYQAEPQPVVSDSDGTIGYFEGQAKGRMETVPRIEPKASDIIFKNSHFKIRSSL